MPITLNNSQARRIILSLQALAQPPNSRQTQADLLALIRQLGFVQVDSIQWVERAHHMILYARNQTYRPKHLKKLIENERLLFENWTHDASIIPCEFYPYWRHKFERDKPRLKEKFVNWQGDGFLTRCETLTEQIREGGGLMSRDIEKSTKSSELDMWQWHDGKAALEFLWRTGTLGISGREGFQKVYDLCNRTIHPEHYSSRVSRDEFNNWACESAIERLGFGTPADIARYWNLISIQDVKDWIEGPGKSKVIPIEVEPVDRSNPRPQYARADIEKFLGDLPSPPSRVRALSPFDPVIRDRNRLTWLFGFDYRIEIYVPEAKRKYGYYIFPLLEGERLIGRVDMKADRKLGRLSVRKLWLEPKVKHSAGRTERLKSEFVRQARLSGVKGVHYEDHWIETRQNNQR